MRYVSLAIIFVNTQFEIDCKCTNNNRIVEGCFVVWWKVCTFVVGKKQKNIVYDKPSIK